MMRPSCFCEFIAENQSMMQLFWTSTATDVWSVSCCVDVFRRVGRCTHSTEAVVGVCSPSTYPFTLESAILIKSDLESAIPDVLCFVSVNLWQQNQRDANI